MIEFHSPRVRLRACLLILTLIAALPAGLAAQQTAREAFHTDVQAFFEDGGRLLTAPARFDEYDWLMTGLALGATAAAYTIDDDLRASTRTMPIERWEIPLAVGEKYGSGLVSGGVGLGLILAGALTDDDETRITGRMVLQSLVYSVTITQLLKVVIGRARPFLDNGKDAFHPMRIDDAFHSFPSGHVTAAFALSATLSRRFDSVPLSIALYALATLTAAERIASDRHWLSDAVLGAVIGGVVGCAVVRFEEERAREEEVHRGPDASVPHFSEDERTPFARHRPLLQWNIAF